MFHRSPMTVLLWALAIIFLVVGFLYALYMTVGAPGTQSPDVMHMSQALENYDTAGAIQAADQILAQDPHNEQALLAKASALALEGSLTFHESEYGTQAIALAQQVLAADPKSYEAWRIIGYSNEIMQQYAAAHDAYAKSLAIDPTYALAVAQDAHAYDLQGDATKAEAGYRAALKLDPTLDQAEVGLGRIFAATNHPSDALPLFEQVASSSKSPRMRAEAAYSAGVIVSGQGDHTKAQQLMQAATGADPSYALAWVGLASQLFAQGNAASSTATDAERSALLQQSLAALQKATTLNPNQTAAYFQLALELATIGQKPLALKTLTHAGSVVNSDITLTPAEKASFASNIAVLQTYLSNTTSL
jgi:tetratricopeptide (TPR) repeat protein